jgi:hypothetical protein
LSSWTVGCFVREASKANLNAEDMAHPKCIFNFPLWRDLQTVAKISTSFGRRVHSARSPVDQNSHIAFERKGAAEETVEGPTYHPVMTLLFQSFGTERWRVPSNLRFHLFFGSGTSGKIPMLKFGLWRDQTVRDAAHVRPMQLTQSGIQIFLLHAGPNFATEKLDQSSTRKESGGNCNCVILDLRRRYFASH